MKKTRICLCCLMLVLIFATLLVSCGKDVEFDITFVVDGEDYATVGTTGEESIKMPEDPTKEGYTFDGWYWDNDVWEKPFTANSLMDTPLSSDMKVYAKWSKIHLHTEGDWITDTEATCAVAGAKHKECAECGEVLETVTIEKPAHTPSTWIVDDEATCAVVGEKHKECTECGETLETETIEKTTQHTEVIDAAVSETDTTDGLTEGKHCSVCGTVLVAQQVIPAHLQGTAIKSAAMTVTGETAYLSLPNNTTAFSFLNDITVANGATYIVARDISCENEINSKTVTLELEDNTYYILVTNGNAQKLYTVTLRRRPMYTVAFNTDGGTAVASQTIEEGAFISAPADPKKTGYTFDGWSRDLALAVTSNLTINANWEANPYTVTYVPNGGTVTAPTASVIFDHSYTLEEPTRTGYTFDGWYYGDDKMDLTGTWTFVQDVTLVAEWTAIEYKITWKNWDGSLLGTTMVAYDSMPSYSGTPQREMDAQHYYVFAGWSPLLVSVTGEATYTAQFTQYESTEYTVKYILNGGSGSFATQIKQKGQPLTLHTGTPTRTGYVFVGWNNIYENTVYNAGGTLELEANVTLWAIWQKITYCSDCNHTGKITTYSTCAFCNRGSKCGSCGSRGGVTIINGLGEVCSSCYSANRVTCSVCKGDYRTSYTNDCADCSGRGYNYNLGTAPTVAGIYVRKIALNALDGYEYSMDGITWQSSPIFENLKPHTSYTFYQRLATNGNTPFGVTSKAATFTTKNDTTYYVTYELNGGSNHQDNPATYATAGSAITLYNPTREHYTFAGWTYNGNAVESISPSWNDDITLVANWTPAKYTITYDLDGGSASNPRTHGIESEAITLIAPTKKGYTFVGWTGSNGHTPQMTVTIEEGNTENLSYIANWSLNTYSITYELNGGTNDLANPSSYTVLDSNISLNTPTKDHYIFKGWQNDTIFISTINTSSVRDYTLVAIWQPFEYSITYDLNGGTASNPTTHNIESSDIVLSAPIKAGYTFTGWTGSNGSVPSTNVRIEAGNTENLTYVATWSLNNYSISYVLYEGTNAFQNPSTYTINDIIILKNASKDYYTFNGWYKESTFVNKVETLDGQYGDLILYASFSPYSYDSLFDANGGAVVYTIIFDYCNEQGTTHEIQIKENEAIDIYNQTIPSKSGYIFAGWYFDKSCTRAVENNFCVTKDLTLYAKWSGEPNTSYVIPTDEKIMTAIGYGASSINGGNYSTTVYFYVPHIFTGEATLTYSYTDDGSAYGIGSITDLTDSKTIYSRKKADGDLNGTITLNLVPGHRYKMYASGTYYHSSSGLGYMGQCILQLKLISKKSIIFNGNNQCTQYYGNETIMPTKAVREGYEFLGWYDEHDNLINPSWTYTSNQTFYAHWKKT
ncbi:MAG: InlB B-repeat-containing protein [Clostridia bacterium]|nr:InlB B-repeat-containing protein [Clostridia bacterium]